MHGPLWHKHYTKHYTTTIHGHIAIYTYIHIHLCMYGTNRLQVQRQTRVTRTKITRGYACKRDTTRVVWLHAYAHFISFMSSFL